MTEADVRAAFDEAWPLLAKAVASYGNTHDKEDIWSRVARGDAQFWTEGDTAAITSIERYDTGLREVQIWLCGGKLGEAECGLLPRIEKWAKGQGVHRINITGRPGWSRRNLPGFRHAAVILVKDL